MADPSLIDFILSPIGRVVSSLTSTAEAPRQGDEGAPDAYLILDSAVQAGLHGTAVGDEIIVLTWLHEADRSILTVHPRGDLSRPEQGVFSTRSASRPNPIGLHRVRVLDMDEATPARQRSRGHRRDADRRPQTRPRQYRGAIAVSRLNSSVRERATTRPRRGAATCCTSPAACGQPADRHWLEANDGSQNHAGVKMGTLSSCHRSVSGHVD